MHVSVSVYAVRAGLLCVCVCVCHRTLIVNIESTNARAVCMVDIVNTPEMRVQKDYAFNLALLEIKQEAERGGARILSWKNTLSAVMFIQHVAFLFTPTKFREGCAHIYYFALIKCDVAGLRPGRSMIIHTRLSFLASFEKNNPSVSLLMNISGVKGRDKGPGCETNPVKEFISLAGAPIHPDALVTSVKQRVKQK